MLERSHRQLDPEKHHRMCGEILEQMSRSGEANFVLTGDGSTTRIVAKVPREQLVFFRIKEGPQTNPSQDPDGPWLIQTPNVSPDSLILILPQIIDKCFPGKSSGVRQYSLSLANHQPPIETIKVPQG